MLLAVDVGNTQTHIGVFEGDAIVYEWRSSTDPARTADEHALLIGQFLSLAGLSFETGLTGFVISSVVPRVTQELRGMSQRYFGWPAVVVEPGTRTGVAILTDNPREVGADRIANAAAAHDMFAGKAVVVADFGTAITIDAVSPKGELLGCAIAPGIDIAATALYSATAQIRRVELVAPSTAIGKTTVTSVQSGLLFGTAALVDGLVERVVKELGGDAEIVATGGLAPIVVTHSHALDRIEPMLTLRGLKLIYERNSAVTRHGDNR
ncbi:type III pantothenate kinase [soil metagenome]